MKKAVIYVHGKNGSYLEAEQYGKNCAGFDLIGVDYNEYLPWIVQTQIKSVYDEVRMKYDRIFLLANSIGAYFSMLSLQECNIDRVLFISPVLDMEQLILDMMGWANVSEKELREKGEIPTNFGETLSWKYLCFVRNNSIIWRIPTKILYGSNDNLISRQTVETEEKNLSDTTDPFLLLVYFLFFNMPVIIKSMPEIIPTINSMR